MAIRPLALYYGSVLKNDTLTFPPNWSEESVDAVNESLTNVVSKEFLDRFKARVLIRAILAADDSAQLSHAVAVIRRAESVKPLLVECVAALRRLPEGAHDVMITLDISARTSSAESAAAFPILVKYFLDNELVSKGDVYRWWIDFRNDSGRRRSVEKFIERDLIVKLWHTAGDNERKRWIEGPYLRLMLREGKFKLMHMNMPEA